ncbi:hypothetical protein LDENG_00214380 [Lucifuga dentata]|nr:hypothetical protein LDENG_00214380 [Lucifuga dentata]
MQNCDSSNMQNGRYGPLRGGVPKVFEFLKIICSPIIISSALGNLDKTFDSPRTNTGQKSKLIHLHLLLIMNFFCA